MTDLLPIPLGTNRPAACKTTFLANIVSLATGFSGVTSPQMHPSGVPGLFSLLQHSDAAICIFPEYRNNLGLVPRASDPEGRTTALRFQSSAKLLQTSLRDKPEHQHSPKS